MLEHYQMPVYEYLTQTLLRHTGLNPAAADAIDLGGGDGLWLYCLLNKGFRSGALVDIDKEQIAAAASIMSKEFVAERWQAIATDVVNMPFADSSFDVAVSRSSMHFWPDLPAAWRELARVLRRGGYVFAGRGFGPDLPEDIRASVKAAKYQTIYGDSNARHQEPGSLSAEELSAIAAGAGFSTVAVIPDHKAYWFLAQKNH
ncbi:MAG: methyltransferase domain-containing protein [Candidatus Riflebacteria bacterium]|nr:methyltransferase domain-containing protein [Candidatus Riflebacteria bacterium]